MKLIFILLFPLLSVAKTDLSVSVQGRSYPSLSASALVDAGYSVNLWGEPNKSNPLFGLIRTNIKASSSIVVNDYDTSVSFYPISFIGFGAGQKKMKSNYNEFSYYDCEEVRCKGDLTKDYSFGKIAFGYSYLVSSFYYSEFRNQYSDEKNEKKPVAEYEEVILANPDYDKSIKRSYLLGLKVDDTVIAFASDNSEYIESEQYYKMNLLIYRKTNESFNYTFGIGGFESSHQGPGSIFIYKLTYIFSESMALF